jgi:hypothetical protein
MQAWVRNSVLLLCGLAGGLSLCELALRFAGFSYPPFITMDKNAGWTLRPGQEGWSEGEARVYLKVNSDGLRDREHTKAKPPNTIRIAVLGDSYAEASQVPMQQAFWAIMEDKLNRCEALRGRRVEIINFGVDGYGTAQELQVFRHHALDYSPDVVLLAFLPSNDISDNSRSLGADTDRPYFVYQGSKLVPDTSFRESRGYHLRQLWPLRWYYRALSYSRVLQLIHRSRNAIRERAVAARLQGQAGTEGRNQEVGLVDVAYREPEDPVWKEAWRVTEGLIVLMRNEARAHGAKFLVVTLTRGVQVHPDPEVRARFMEKAGVGDIFYPDSRIGALGQREGLEVLSLAPRFQAYAQEHQVFLHGFGTHLGEGHWNEKGHHLAAEMISARLCQDLRRNE